MENLHKKRVVRVRAVPPKAKLVDVLKPHPHAAAGVLPRLARVAVAHVGGHQVHVPARGRDAARDPEELPDAVGRDVVKEVLVAHPRHVARVEPVRVAAHAVHAAGNVAPEALHCLADERAVGVARVLARQRDDLDQVKRERRLEHDKLVRLRHRSLPARVRDVDEHREVKRRHRDHVVAERDVVVRHAAAVVHVGVVGHRVLRLKGRILRVRLLDAVVKLARVVQVVQQLLEDQVGGPWGFLCV